MMEEANREKRVESEESNTELMRKDSWECGQEEDTKGNSNEESRQPSQLSNEETESERAWSGSQQSEAEIQNARNKLDPYFKGYSRLEIHQEMLEDRQRTDAYNQAIMNSAELFKDKVVLDLGAGTLILSFFAVKAGAKKVIAVDNAAIAKFWPQLIKDNGMQGKIECHNEKIENLPPPEPDEMVDIIVSQWMGYFLAYQGMLSSLLFARDNWLKHDGLMFPDRATMEIALSDYVPQNVKFWQKPIYGFNMSCLGRDYLHETFVQYVTEEQLITPPITILHLNLKTIKLNQQEPYAKHQATVSITRQATAQSIVGWFSVKFPDGTELQTGPGHQTHWKQAVMALPSVEPTERVNANDQVKVDIAVARNFNTGIRDLKIEAKIDFPTKSYKHWWQIA